MKRRDIVDTELYDVVVRAAKQRFDVWPSPAASAWVIRQYKDGGGRFRSKPSDTHRVQDALSVSSTYWPSKEAVLAEVKPVPRTRRVQEAD